ncbi:dockerin type I repeat-containing protein [uncultured Ruminococcus sp.]|uniref:dockerin type I repeat-containing protein n=1 Tax=uncultured Ruminococcus sp. TaxID=165186 RepID=UPI0025FFBED3|nr:dockerin type I repeat-containing protein [uncultured Ruminococcus sp.]
MRTIRTRWTSFATALVMLLTAVTFLPCCAVKVSAEDHENYFDRQDDREVEYDRSKWIQPQAWNCPKIDPKNYKGSIMLFFDKIGTEGDFSNGKVQRVYASIVGADIPVNRMKFHIFYDTRLKVEPNNEKELIFLGTAVKDKGFTTGSELVKDGEIVFYAYSSEDVALGRCSLFMIDFVVPKDAERGDHYPIGISYIDDGIAYDCFMDSSISEASKLQMTYLFTKGIYNGYLYISGEPVVKRTYLDLRAPRDGENCTSDPAVWFGEIPDDVKITDLIWAESSTMKRGTEGDTFKAGKSYTLQFKLTPAYGKDLSKKFEVWVNGMKQPFSTDDITRGGTCTVEIEAVGRLRGDLNGDGAVNVSDVSILAAHVKGVKKMSDASAADLNGDGSINVSDIAMLAAHVKGIKKLS